MHTDMSVHEGSGQENEGDSRRSLAGRAFQNLFFDQTDSNRFIFKKRKEKKKVLVRKKKKNTWTERTSRTRRCRKLRPRHLHASAQVGLRDLRQNRYRICAQDCYPQQKKIETYFFRVRKKMTLTQNPNREQIQIPASELGSNNQRT